MPYRSTGNFMDFFEGLTYEHVNFIFADPSYAQESAYPSMNTSLYKFGLSEPGSFSYYDYGHAYVVNDHARGVDEYSRESTPILVDQQTAALHAQCEGNSSATSHANPVECKF
ncbi:unnamed protein product [Ilex paraguariensis]|uniref:Uncharacterized protein n=1 Tax=Ilex paraguariensis TaxID=185542 RepID=A0ABC8V4M6_9AQUA